MALSESFKSYRKRVIADVGEDKDKEYRFGVTKELVQVTNEDGSKEMVERTVIDPTTVSQYARFFDAGNPNWTRNPEMNLMFLRSQQNWANDLLHARGHVFLNEVYDMLGMPRSEPGCVVGWVDGHGDSFIDFGFYNGVDSASRDFVNGFEKTVLLDFNVDGMIMDIFNKKAFRDRLGAER
jgi:hypothetical protein